MDLEERASARTVGAADASRILVTLLFTDLVGSTMHASEVGDRRWRDLLLRHHCSVRELIGRWEGLEMDCAGDGFFATFATASNAVDCGLRIIRTLRTLDLAARVGIHTGECERLGPKVSGVAVHTAARVVAVAGSSEVLVTATVKGVAEGSGLRFTTRGEHRLKGLPGIWPLFAAVDTACLRERGGAQNVNGTHAPRRRGREAVTRVGVGAVRESSVDPVAVRWRRLSPTG